MKPRHKSLKRIVWAVLAAHLLAIASTSLRRPASQPPKASTPVVVQTVQLRPKPTPPVAKSPPPAPKPVAKKPPPKPVAKKEPPPKPVAKKKPTPKPVAKKAPPAPPAPDREEQRLLAAIAESIAKIDQTDDKQSPSAVKETPKEIGDLSVDKVVSAAPSQADYEADLMQRLRLLLRLPDYGAVKVKLTVQRNGKVAALQVLDSQSDANAAYVKKELPALTLPSFGKHFRGQATHTFTVTLTNKV